MNAAVCYVYLSDVPGNCPVLDDDSYVHPVSLRWIETFEESRWFTRGWTLQELIAPRKTLFFGCDWNPIGALANLVQRVSGITNIQTDVLEHTRPLSDLSIARRLSWAAKRTTTRSEDEAYCLFGILDINMPLLYGEGPKAFLRLQEEIIRQSTDQSIFAWDSPYGFIDSRELLFAPSVRCFVNGSKIRRRRGTASESAFRLSNKGVEITLPIVRRQLHEDPASPDVVLGILDCKYEGSSEVLAIVMSQHPFKIQAGTMALELYVSGYEQQSGATSRYARLLPISSTDSTDAKSTLLTITKDLQSQTYIQAFNSNEESWFPIRFTGDDVDSIPVLQDVYPEHCWYNSSRTLRLKAPSALSGGIVVRLKDGRCALIIFGIIGSTHHSLVPSRRVYRIVFIHPECSPGPHIKSLIKQDWNHAGASAGLKLNKDEKLVARLWRGALTVSIENAAESSVYAGSSSGSTLSPLSPPPSPFMSRSSPNLFSSPPSSPLVQRRDSKNSVGSSKRMDLRRSLSNVDNDTPHRVHRTKLCEHCRAHKEKEDAEAAAKQRRAEEEKAAAATEAEAIENERRQSEKHREMRKKATQAGVGFSLGSVFFDALDGFG